LSIGVSRVKVLDLLNLTGSFNRKPEACAGIGTSDAHATRKQVPGLRLNDLNSPL
jgi:hypothetical protein